MTSSTDNLLLVDAEVSGQRVDVRLGNGRVLEVAPHLTGRGERILRCHGGALIPGLHDHHLHLNALAAARRSTFAGPPDVRSVHELERTLSRASQGDGWIRAVGYDDSTAGPLDRCVLDSLVPDRPVRVQHRSGALWILNSRALDLVSSCLDDSADVERDTAGRPNGRLWRYDRRLLPALPNEEPAQRNSLRSVTRQLFSLGVTGVTDATPDLDHRSITLLKETSPLGVHLLGAPDGLGLPRRMTLGPRKVLLRDHDLPSFDDLAGAIDPGSAGPSRRPVAVHCVTRESLLLTLAVLDEIGCVAGDRIEHAAVVPEGTEDELARLGPTVVTQPDFLRTKGDGYLRDVDLEDHEHLYRWAGLARAGVRVVGSSDAPFGELDPWQVIRSASERATATGRVIGRAERVDARTALDGYLTGPENPGGRPRRVAAGAPANLCLLTVPLAVAMADPSADLVSLTILEGTPAAELTPDARRW